MTCLRDFCVEIENALLGTYPTDYSTIQEEGTMAVMFKRVIECISKPADSRLDTEIDVLIPWLRKRSDVLRKLPKGKNWTTTCRFSKTISGH